MPFYLTRADAVADEMELPTQRISLEMLFRGFYHFTVASDRGNNQSLVEYFCDPKNKDLGIVKAKRFSLAKSRVRPLSFSRIDIFTIFLSCHEWAEPGNERTRENG